MERPILNVFKKYYPEKPLEIIKSLFLMRPSKNTVTSIMSQSTETEYIIPARYRRMENMHIVFWLMKDISWCMIWKALGITMIIPTLTIAIVIAWRTRHIAAELSHNLAIAFWISANSLWMISEFFGFDTMVIWNGFTGKHLALVPFIIGISILLYYYVVQRPKEIKLKKAVTT